MNLDEEEVECEIDKCHRVGPVKEDGTQSTIINQATIPYTQRENLCKKKETQGH